jgi:probable HAF family extracellular repeat protein
MVVAALAGLPGYPRHHVTGVNDLGQIVGSAQGNGPTHAVMWSPHGGATGLGPGLATAINQHGQVLGVDSATGLKPWVWFGGTRKTIAPPTAVRALAYVINESGDVPMTYSTSTLGQYDRAAVWEDGRHTELPLTGAYVSLEAINDAGVVAGSHSSFETQEFTAIRCLDGDCAKLAGVQTGYGPYGPEAINEAGVVVGSRGTVALRWEGDEVTVLSENGARCCGRPTGKKSTSECPRRPRPSRSTSGAMSSGTPRTGRPARSSGGPAGSRTWTRWAARSACRWRPTTTASWSARAPRRTARRKPSAGRRPRPTLSADPDGSGPDGCRPGRTHPTG